MRRPATARRRGPRVVVITGGSSGIGRGTARHFARLGWRVGIIARGQAGLDAARDELVGLGAMTAIAQADVTDSASLGRAADIIASGLGPIDVWINNAGIGVFARFTEMTEAEFARVTDVNYGGVVNGTRIALARMMPRDAGHIVNVSSAIGIRATPLFSAYAGAKFAIRGFSDAVRAELVHAGSRVVLTTVFPPSVNTPFYSHAIARIGASPRPPPPIYQPELVTEAIHLAATTRRREMLIGGQTLLTAIAQTLAPALTEWLAARLAPWLKRSSNPGIEAERDENVFTPSRLASASRGPFDRESRGWSAQVWATRNRGRIALGLGAVALAIASRAR